MAYEQLTAKDLFRMMKKIQFADPDECWAWNASTNGKGYGRFRVSTSESNTLVYPHVIMWELHNNQPVPRDRKLELLHSCNNSSCVNPTHLRADTHKRNMADAGKDELMARGEVHYRSQLTEDDVRSIRKLYPSISQYKLAEMYGVSRGCIGQIIYRRTWKHLEDENA